MLTRLSGTLCAFLSLAPLAIAAPPADAPAVDAEAILKTLKEIQERNESHLRSTLQKAIHDFRHAAGVPSRAVDFYEDAVRATRFAGKNLQQTEFQQWKKKEADKLRSADLQEAAQLHLQYLALSLEYAAKTPMENLLPGLIRYTDQVYSAREETLRNELMRRPISNSIFAHWYGVTLFLQQLKSWEMTPANADGIWERTVLPELRKLKDIRAVHYWDQRLQRAEERVNKSRQEFEREHFNTIEKPALLWNRAQELNEIGLRNHAINEMLAVIKKYPAHPDNPRWIARLTEMLKPASPGEATP